MFIGRKDGLIYGTWTVRQWEKQEELPDDNAEVVAFLNRSSGESKREKAIEALLTKEALDPLAPQEVKDYARKI